MTMHIGHMLKRRDGQNLVEFALIAPILFMIVFGIVEFGNAWMRNTTLTSAAREGARAAAVSTTVGSMDSDAREAIQRTLEAAGITSGYTVNVTPPEAVTERFTVTVSMNYASLVGEFIPGINGILLHGSTTMRKE